jgi:hypothetical protein
MLRRDQRVEKEACDGTACAGALSEQGPETMNAAQRKALRDTMKLLIDNEPLVNYPLHDVRGKADAATWALTGEQMRSRLKQGRHLMMDCSQGIACVYKWSGLGNPSGNISGPGFTGSMLDHLGHHSDPARARVGAIVVYGPSTGEHASLVYQAGADPLLWSHGFDGGPQLIRLSKQRTVHRGPVTFLDVSGIGPA